MSLPHAFSVSSPQPAGKFLRVGNEQFLVKGVSYGTFAPDNTGYQLPPLTQVAGDFAAMTQSGINTVRTYTVPRCDFLDEAAAAGLHVIVGIPWTQHVAFLDDRATTRAIRRRIIDEVRTLAAHPATLLVALGNEIPPGVVRWHGAARVEQFLRDVYDGAKAVAPETSLTYVNYPPTEYLDLPFLDVCAFNVYLHRETDLRAYLAHLHVVAGNRPLLLTEIGADRMGEGEQGQADLAAMQVKTAFEEGACGAVVFSWTDDWWRGGHQVEDWRFGLTDAERQPKLALFSVSREYTDAGFGPEQWAAWPRVSVLVCAHNASDTIDECLHALGALTYPDYEVIVVNDGSSDATSVLARRHAGMTVIDTGHVGLSAARNIALERASGAVVAYTDADVRVDPEWLMYLIQPFLRSDAVGSGGPNVVPTDDPWAAQCVARAPGSPTHVLIDDRTAEHVPGCNMAFRRDVLVAIGGFDTVYHAAGDDVDVCWRLQAHGYRIDFAPSALVWHRHRDSVKAYWRQQVGYGEAETWLMDAHPERFFDGQALWKGRIYSALPFVRAISRVRINAGAWGTAVFPTVYSMQVSSLNSLPHLMSWQMASAILALIGGICLAFGQHRPAGVFLIAAMAGVATTVFRCLVYGWRTDVSRLHPVRPWGNASGVLYRLMIAWLHVVQPIARAWGRFRGRLWPPVVGDRRVDSTPVRRVFARHTLWLDAVPLLARRLNVTEFWSERWVDRASLLSEMTKRLQSRSVPRAVDAHDPWQQDRDLAVATGRWGWVDLRTLLEEHDGGRCLLRVAARHRLTPWGAVVITSLSVGVMMSALLGLVAPLVACLGVGAAIVGSAWRRATRVHAGVHAIVRQVAAEYGLLPMDAGAAPSFSLPRLAGTRLTSPGRQRDSAQPTEPRHTAL